VSLDTGMDLAYELMTGWASSQFFISRATLGALDDLGYVVDYSKAGVVDHVVVVTIPESSLAALPLCIVGLVMRRRR